jgi:hypothetical protein
MSQTPTIPMIEQAAIQAGLAFFYTLAGVLGSSPILDIPVNWPRIIVAAGISAGLAFFIKLSLGTGGQSTPITQPSGVVTP